MMVKSGALQAFLDPQGYSLKPSPRRVDSVWPVTISPGKPCALGQASGKLTDTSIQPSPRVSEPGPSRTCPQFQEQNPTQGIQKGTLV